MSFLLRNEACNFIKKETQTQKFPCEFCENFKSIFLWNISGGCYSIFMYRIFTYFFTGLKKFICSKASQYTHYVVSRSIRRLYAVANLL